MRRACFSFLLFLAFMQVGIAQLPYQNIKDKKDTITYDIHGIQMVDNFHWMENWKSKRLKKWLRNRKKEEKEYFGSNENLKQIAEIYFRTNQFENYDYSKHGPYFCQVFNHGKSLEFRKFLNEQIYDSLLFDVGWCVGLGAYSPQIEEYQISEDNKYMSFELDLANTGVNCIRVIDIARRKVLKDKIDFVYLPTVQWYKDGFFYSKSFEIKRFKTIDSLTYSRIYYHKVNTKSSEDILVYSNKENKQPELFNFFVDRKAGRLYVEDFSLIEGKKRFVLSYTSCDSIGDLSFKPFFVSNPNVNFLDKVIGTLGNEILVMTGLGASTFQVLAISPDKGLNQGRVIIPAYKDVLNDVIYSENRFYCLYFSQGKYTLNVADSLGNTIQYFDFPVGINVEGLKSGQLENVINLRLSSFFQPPITYLLNKETLESYWVGITKVNYAFKEYKIDYVEYQSKDSTLVPMYICHKGPLVKDGSNPTLLDGYGGFGIRSKPEFNLAVVTWIEMGGVYALPVIRGGSDLGLDWYRQTIKEGKQIVVDDFIKAAEYLIDSNIACPDKLALEGGSHGGWLVNMVANQRPDLCKAIISSVGPSDLVRTQMDTNRIFVIKEFGEIQNAEDVKRLITFSPLFNVRKNVSYPSILFETARYDFNVNPFQVFKMLENLKEQTANTNPILLLYSRMGYHNGPFDYDEYQLHRIKRLFF